MLGRFFSLMVVTLVFTPACSTSFSPKSCKVDSDCGSSLACSSDLGACVAPSTVPIKIGTVTALSGPNEALGTQMKLGMDLAFNDQNANGGIHGRQVVLTARDDQYDATLTDGQVKDILDLQVDMNASDMPHCPTSTMAIAAGTGWTTSMAVARGPNGVMTLIGDVGTPTMVRAAPIAVETSTLFFGAFTGATTMLRDSPPAAGPCAKYIFNVRASYANEAMATAEYFFQTLKVPDYYHLISFDQSDSFGQAGYTGLLTAVETITGMSTLAPAMYASQPDPSNPIPRFRYNKSDLTTVPVQVTAVSNYLATLLTGNSSNHTVGIFMTDTYGPALAFITGLRTWQYANDTQQTMINKATRLTLIFSNVSFVGPNKLSDLLKAAGTVTTPGGATKPYTDNVFVTQVVPNYQSDTSDVVVQYNKLIGSAGQAPTFTSLEGYIAARVFLAGLSAHTGAFTPDALIPTFEGLTSQASLGLGGSSGFSPMNHNYSKAVWGTAIQPDGTFNNVFFFSDGSPLQLYQ